MTLQAVWREEQMAKQLRKFWEFLNTDIRELAKPTDVTEAGIETTKFALEFGVALGILSTAVNPVGIAIAGLSGAGLAIKGVRLYRQQKGNKLSLEEWVALAAPLAYLDSLNELVKGNEILQQWSVAGMPVDELADDQMRQFSEFHLNEELAKNALSCFHQSELAQALNQRLKALWERVKISKSEAEILTAWVAWGTHPFLKPTLSELEDTVRDSVELYLQGQGNKDNKYANIETYLQEQIANLPNQQVFAEEFTFQDIYVPLKAERVDKNVDEEKKDTAFDLETWAKRILTDKTQQHQVIFIQGGPGRGKSVFCRMFADWVRQHWHPLWTPVLIRLRDISKLQPSFRETLREAVATNFATSNDWLTDRNTRFLFLLDGFDELVMEGRSSGLEEFLRQVGQFQQDCQRSPDMGHRILVTGRPLALQNLERFMPPNLERVEIQLMDEEVQQQWFTKWSLQVGEEKSELFAEFLQDERIIESVGELASEPLLLYLLAAMHRDGHLSVQKLEGTSGIQTKILIYQESLRWVLEEQRPQWLSRRQTTMETAGLQCILAEAALCVVQSGRECAPLPMLKERIQDSEGAAGLIKQAEQRLGDEALKNALAAFYLQPTHREKGGSVEFAHKSFSEFLFAQLLAERLVGWTEQRRRSKEFLVKKDHMHEEIYDLLGYGGLTLEIVEYLMGLLRANEEFQPVQLFKRLELFYLRWCNGEFIDIPEETLPQKKTRQFKEHGITFGQRQV
ncbi:MAG: NACHT domain-containing protein [Symploca sp. SIO2E9]|nr:NACHT domain-containing protein [Symploca sp. SIO2E9]